MCWEDSASWDPIPFDSCCHYGPGAVMPSFSPREFRSEKHWSFSLVRSRDPFCPLTKGRESNTVDFPNYKVYLQLHPNPRCSRTIPLGRSLLLMYHICLSSLDTADPGRSTVYPATPNWSRGCRCHNWWLLCLLGLETACDSETCGMWWIALSKSAIWTHAIFLPSLRMFSAC